MKLEKGKHSVVEIFEDFVIKKFDKELKYNFYKEVYFLKGLDKFGFVPKIIKYDPKNLSIYMEKIDGIRIWDFIKNEDPKKVKEILRKILDICYFLDKNGIEKTEMRNPYKHILIKYPKVYFIDWERSYEKENPRNLSKFIQALISKKDLLEKKGIKIGKLIDRKDVIKEYNKKKDKKSFKEILKILGLI